jgi:hypothetical protein
VLILRSTHSVPDYRFFPALTWFRHLLTPCIFPGKKILPFSKPFYMQRIILFLFLLTLSASLYAQSDKKKVWNLVVQLEQSLVAKDSAGLHKLLRPDFVGATPMGWVYRKEEYIWFHCRPGIGLMNLQTGTMDNAIIRIYGNTAIVNRPVKVQRKEADGKLVDVTIQRIEVLIKENGEWLLASGQGSQLSNLPKPVKN